MDDIPSVLDPDELMDLEEPETYDLDDDDDDIPDDPSTSPFQHFSSGMFCIFPPIMIYFPEWLGKKKITFYKPA